MSKCLNHTKHRSYFRGYFLAYVRLLSCYLCFPIMHNMCWLNLWNQHQQNNHRHLYLWARQTCGGSDKSLLQSTKKHVGYSLSGAYSLCHVVRIKHKAQLRLMGMSLVLHVYISPKNTWTKVHCCLFGLPVTHGHMGSAIRVFRQTMQNSWEPLV